MTPQPSISPESFARLIEQVAILTHQVQELRREVRGESDVLPSCKAAAEWAGVSTRTISRWVDQGLARHGRAFRKSEIIKFREETGL
jgi:hypothetical protein